MNKRVFTAAVLAPLAVVISGCVGRDDAGSSIDALIDDARSDDDAIIAQEYSEFDGQQQQIVECMKLAGFKYQPRPAGQSLVAVTNSELKRRAQDASSLGYRISIATESPPVEHVPDPNQAYVDSLNSAGQASWINALYGLDGSGGCAQTVEPTPSDRDRRDSILAAAFGSEWEGILDQVYADQRIIEGDQSWIECMKTAGFDFAAPIEAVRFIEQRAPTALEAGGAGLVELQQQERLIAAADAACPFNNFGGWQSEYQAVLDEYEAEFLREHEAEVLALLGESAG